MRRAIVSAVLPLCVVTAAWASTRAPVTVSPGGESALARVEARCPTFSWGEVEGARSYELVVYRLAEEGAEAEVVVERSFPGSVDTWTPSLEACLARGVRYAWSVRAIGREEASAWSPPSLFEVAADRGPAALEAALAAVGRRLAAEGSRQGPAAAAAPAAPRREPAGPPPRSAAAGPSRSGPLGSLALSLDDNLQVTTGDTPVLRLAQDDTLGFDVYLWDVAANAAGFSVRDATGSTAPFQIASGAPSDSLVVEASGNVKTVSVSGDGAGLTGLDPASLAGTVAIAQGGTGATTAAAACATLGAATQAGLDAHKGADDHAATYLNVGGDTMAGALVTAATLDVNGALDASGASSVQLPGAGLSGAGSGSGLDADLLDGLDSSAYAAAAHAHPYQAAYARTVVVSPVPGDAVASGAALVAALAAITDASATNPYLLKVEPGLYDLGSGSLAMKEWVDVEGSGEGVTRITAVGGTSCNPASITATVQAAANAELRWLTAEAVGGACPTGLLFDGVSPRATHVTARGVDASVWPASGSGAFVRNGAAPILTDLTLLGTGSRWGTGLQVWTCSPAGPVPTVRRVRAHGVSGSEGGIGVTLHECGIAIRDSVLLGEGGYAGAAISTDEDCHPCGPFVARVEDSVLEHGTKVLYADRDFTFYLAGCRFEGGAAQADASATLVCAGVWDESFTFYPGSCP